MAIYWLLVVENLMICLLAQYTDELLQDFYNSRAIEHEYTSNTLLRPLERRHGQVAGHDPSSLLAFLKQAFLGQLETFRKLDVYLFWCMFLLWCSFELLLLLNVETWPKDFFPQI